MIIQMLGSFAEFEPFRAFERSMVLVNGPRGATARDRRVGVGRSAKLLNLNLGQQENRKKSSDGSRGLQDSSGCCSHFRATPSNITGGRLMPVCVLVNFGDLSRTVCTKEAQLRKGL
jgi:hypothetical protein